MTTLKEKLEYRRAYYAGRQAELDEILEDLAGEDPAPDPDDAPPAVFEAGDEDEDDLPGAGDVFAAAFETGPATEPETETEATPAPPTIPDPAASATDPARRGGRKLDTTITAAIADALKNGPKSQRILAELLGVSEGTVYRHLTRFEGCFESTGQGYRLTDYGAKAKPWETYTG